MQNELFKDGCIGSDLELALLTMFNGIKDHQDIPPFFNLSNITSLYKNKGSREDLDNDRGIFVLTIFKKILDKLIYCDNFGEIDKGMSHSCLNSAQTSTQKN